MRRAAAFITITIQRAENLTKVAALGIPRISNNLSVYSGLDRGLKQTSNTINSIAAQESAEQDASRIKKATSDYESSRNKFLYGTTDEQGTFVPGLMNTVGEEAVNPADGITLDKKLEDWQQQYKENVIPQLGNPRQRDMFTQSIDAAYPSAQAAVAKHEWSQGQAVKIGNAKAATEISTDTAIALGINPAADKVLYQEALDKMKDSVQVQAMLEGFGPESEYAKELLSEKMSKLHTNVIVAKISGDDDQGAIDYYEEHSSEITDQSENRIIGEKIKKIKVSVEGKDIAAGIWEEHRPEDVNGLIDLDAMRQEVRDGKGSEEVKEIALSSVDQSVQEYLQQARAKQEEISNSIHGMPAQGKTHDQVIKAISLNDDIDNMAKDNLMSWADRKYKVNEKEAEDKQALSLNQLVNLMNFQAEYMNGDYGTLDPEQVSTKTGDLGPYTDNAMTFVQNVNADLGTAKVTDADMKDLIITLRQNDKYADLLPNLNKPNDKDKAQFVLLQGTVQNIMARSKDQPGAGKSVQAALLEAITEVRTDDGWIYNTYDPAYLVGTNSGTDYAKEEKFGAWSKEAQDTYLTTRWSQQPSNNGKTLDPVTLEQLRQTLLKTGE